MKNAGISFLLSKNHIWRSCPVNATCRRVFYCILTQEEILSYSMQRNVLGLKAVNNRRVISKFTLSKSKSRYTLPLHTCFKFSLDSSSDRVRFKIQNGTNSANLLCAKELSICSGPFMLINCRFLENNTWNHSSDDLNWIPCQDERRSIWKPFWETRETDEATQKIS